MRHAIHGMKNTASDVPTDSALERLPSELIATTMSMLPARDMCRFGLTSRRMLACYELEQQRCAAAYVDLYGLPWTEDLLSFGKPNASAALRAAKRIRDKLPAIFATLRRGFDLDAFHNRKCFRGAESDRLWFIVDLESVDTSMVLHCFVAAEVADRPALLWDTIGRANDRPLALADQSPSRGTRKPFWKKLWGRAKTVAGYAATQNDLRNRRASEDRVDTSTGGRSHGRVVPPDLMRQLWRPSKQGPMPRDPGRNAVFYGNFEPWRADKLDLLLFTCAALVAVTDRDFVCTG
eukprot:TRINITY_DN865_c1_g1_i4.p1 TRINITY_DN865_c1_g1~~TRINITY_DN865_c1_g1_i4.p1  ORF type:complete len:293 (+),score=23.99 TRINITY_DN865_c1_g1_i4:105-983(+)